MTSSKLFSALKNVFGAYIFFFAIGVQDVVGKIVSHFFVFWVGGTWFYCLFWRYMAIKNMTYFMAERIFNAIVRQLFVENKSVFSVYWTTNGKRKITYVFFQFSHRALHQL